MWIVSCFFPLWQQSEYIYVRTSSGPNNWSTAWETNRQRKLTTGSSSKNATERDPVKDKTPRNWRKKKEVMVNVREKTGFLLCFTQLIKERAAPALFYVSAVLEVNWSAGPACPRQRQTANCSIFSFLLQSLIKRKNTTCFFDLSLFLFDQTNTQRSLPQGCF